MKISFAFVALAAVMLSDVVQANTEELTLTSSYVRQVPAENMGEATAVVSDAKVDEVVHEMVDEIKNHVGLRRKLRQQGHRKLFDLFVTTFFVNPPVEVPCSATALFTHPGTCVTFSVTYGIILETITAADRAEFFDGLTAVPSPDDTILAAGLEITDPQELEFLELLVAGLLAAAFTQPVCAADALATDPGVCAASEFGTRILAFKGETAVDPHFKTFGGDWYDFHGGCDLVLLDVPDYDNESGLTVDIRTTVRYAYSFIETLAIKVGEDILQVSSWGDYMINGISNAELEGATLNGLPVTREAISEKQFKFVVTLANGHHFTIKVFKDMISTSFDIPEEHSVLGLLGNHKGDRVARDGITIMEEPNEFGQEWQVQDLDHQLFATVREPQFPTKCIMPDPVEREQRRLSATVSQEAAEAACSHIKDEHVRDMCIFDVISVDDLSLAAGAY